MARSTNYWLPASWTVPLVVTVAACFFLFNTIGFPYVINPGPSGNAFGWPFAFLMTSLTDEQWQQIRKCSRAEDAVFIDPGEISFAGVGPEDIDWNALKWNGVALFLLLVCVALGTECVQSGRLRRYRFTLQGMFSLLTMVATFAVASRWVIMLIYYFELLQHARLMSILLYVATMVTSGIFAIRLWCLRGAPSRSSRTIP